MCSPRRIEKPQAKGYMLWVLEAERQRRERNLKSLEEIAHFVIVVAILIFVSVIGVSLYMLVK